MSSELVLTNVDKIYGAGSVHAVKDLSFAVKPGEITALLGSSGCGKTSTLRMIAGFETVTNGAIAHEGKYEDIEAEVLAVFREEARREEEELFRLFPDLSA